MRPPSTARPDLQSAPADQDDAFALLVNDDVAARDGLEAAFARCQAAEDGEAALQCSAAAVVSYAVEFADFRGLAAWIVRFDALHRRHGSAPRAPLAQLRVDSALITLPSLDGAAQAGPACAAAAERSAAHLRCALPLAADERMLHLKMLLDYHSFLHHVPSIEACLALGHEAARGSGCSPLWQARWWLVALLNHDYFGQSEAGHEAALQLRRLLDRHELPALQFELACIEMSAALKADDLTEAERLFRQIERLRPAVRRGRLPHGLRAQASYLARRGEFGAALDRVRLLLALCAEVDVPRRDQGAYEVLGAYCLAALRRWDESRAVLVALRPDQQDTQGEVLEAIIDTIDAARALDEGAADAAGRCASALARCATLHFNRFLLAVPPMAARLVQAGLDQGVVSEFLAATVHDRLLQPPDPTREHWPWRVRLRVLGGLQVERDGEPLPRTGGKAQRKPLELLALLAAHGGAPLPQPVVIYQLWPSPEAEAPKASFEMAVSRLRKLLGLADLVRVADGQVALDTRRVWIDAAAFSTLCERGDEASLAQAMALYRGPLLGHESLTGLAHTARARLALQHGAAARSLAQRQLDRGDAAGAAVVYRAALAHEPLAEALHRGLIEALARQGEKAEALAAYRRLTELLSRGLDAVPSAQTENLVQAVRDGVIGPAGGPARPA